jgi:hypothetical protein
MPDYSFFLSYASSDRLQVDRDSETTSKRDFVRIFFDDLDLAMRGHGYPDGGFFDKLRLEAKWKPDLQVGLASSRILVPLYSTNYFLGPYCGKEWETFNQRFDENKRLRYSDVTTPKVILPVFWKGQLAFPAEVKEYQIDFEGYPPDYAKRGLAYMVQYKRDTLAYGNFMFDFSAKLKKLADGQGRPKVRDLADFDTLNPPFPGNNRPGLKFVRYVCVAGMKYQMSDLRATAECYATFQDRSVGVRAFPILTGQWKELPRARQKPITEAMNSSRPRPS